MSRFEFSKLDARTRGLMAEEIVVATQTDNLYYAARFTEPVLERTHKDASALLREVRDSEMSVRCDLLKPNSGLTADY